VKGLNDASKRLDTFGKSLQGIGTKMAMLGAGVVAPLAGAAKVFADMGSDMVDMSQRTGVSVEALSCSGNILPSKSALQLCKLGTNL